MFLLVLAVAHGPGIEAGPLGVGGFPDCWRRHPELDLTMEEASMDLACAQKPGGIKVGCIGDSITAGVHSSGGDHPYPKQLQMLFDKNHGAGAYSVTNLGACGSTMLKKGNSPYWQRPQFDTLKAGGWDVITIMLGTNDAKDPADHGPSNWLHDCGGAEHTTLSGCSFAADYAAMIDLVRTLGSTPEGPEIYIMVPPPLMAPAAYGMNQTVIDSVFPKLLPLIAQANKVKLIDVFSGMGGRPDWSSAFPGKCALNSSFAPCGWWCDAQSCDQCHPNDVGYAHLAEVVYPHLAQTELVV